MTEQAIIKNYLIDLGICPDDSDIEKLLVYLDLLFEYNKNINLVGTKNRDEILIRHFFDCLSIFKFLNSSSYKIAKNAKLLDIGTGAGLPGLLLSIFLKKSEIYLLDSKDKAISFLRKAINSLKLDNVYILFGRAEELAHDTKYRENFDIIVSRALAKTSILAELCLPFCKIGGRAVLYKSKNLSEELRSSDEIINLMGAEIENILEVKIPSLNEYRALLILKKVSPALYKYPRKYGKILKIPINKQ
jgi:16S rRNA (guanine527-N7)-methyltransferase